MAEEKKDTEIVSAEETAPVKRVIPGLVFDFNRITARQIHEVNDILRGNDIPRKSELFASLCDLCPEHWGDPNNPDTFLNLPWFGECGFVAVQTHFMVTFGDPAKN